MQPDEAKVGFLRLYRIHRNSETISLSPALPFALQFSKSSNPGQQRAMRGGATKHLQPVRKFVEKFRSTLSEEVLSDQAFSFKVFLIPKVGTHAKPSHVTAHDLFAEFSHENSLYFRKLAACLVAG